MIRLVLAEDQAMVRGALAALLRLETDFDLRFEAGDGESAWQAVQEHAPDILITDIEMPRLTGLELAQRIRDAGLATRVVIVTTFGRAGYLRRALDAGVRGYLLKDAPSDQLAAALRQVQAGGRAIDPQLAVAAWDETDPLSERELDVLRGICQEFTTAEIATKLFVSPRTVDFHRNNLLLKTGAKNAAGLVVYAITKGHYAP